jgi:4-aminobutyrate aminotransferase-like enzyme
MTTTLDQLKETQKKSHNIGVRDLQWVARPTRRIPLAVAAAHGSILIDADGREVIDLTSGWNVCNIGWNHPRVVEAVKQQAAQLSFAPPWCTHDGRPGLAERLSHYLGGNFAALCGSNGSESVEAALKVARRATKRHAVVGFTEAYHGGTLGSMMAGGVPSLHGVDLPKDEWHRHAPIPDMLRAGERNYGDIAREIILQEPQPAAVLLEPVFTNPGVLAGDDHFYKSIAETASACGALVIIDEIGTGFGRTGSMFGFQQLPIQPDIVVVAKAISSGAVPMAGALMRSELVKFVSGAGFSSTFGWTPLACAAANATLDVIEEEGLAARARELGKKASKRLGVLRDEVGHVADVREHGLEIGVELVKPDGTPVSLNTMLKLARTLLGRGIFAEPSSYTSTLLIMPPLSIPEEQFLHALDIVVDTITGMDVIE